MKGLCRSVGEDDDKGERVDVSLRMYQDTDAAAEE